MSYLRQFTCFVCVALISMLTVSADAGNEPPKVTLIMKSLANEFFQNMARGAREHQHQNPNRYKLIEVGLPNETDINGQIALIDQAIAEHSAAIVITPIDSKVLPALKRAIKAGIIVVNIDDKLDDQALMHEHLNIPFVGPSNRQGARMVGELIGRQLRSGEEVAILEGVSTASNAQARTAGFRDAMDAVSAKIVSIQSGNWEIAPARTIVQGWLKQYPSLRAILAGNDNMAIGAIDAIRAAGKSGRVLVGGYDNLPAVQPLLASHEVSATIDQFASKQAEFGIELALRALTEKLGQDELPSLVSTPIKLITP